MRKQAIIALAVVLLFSTAGLASAYTYQRIPVAESSYEAVDSEGAIVPEPEDIAMMEFFDPFGYPENHFWWQFDDRIDLPHVLTVNQTCYFQFFDEMPCNQFINRYFVLRNTQSMRAENRNSAGQPITTDGKWVQLKFYYPGQNQIQVTAKGLLPNTEYSIIYPYNHDFDYDLTELASFTTTSSGTWTGYKDISDEAQSKELPGIQDYTSSHSNNAYTHKLGARVWVVPSAYVDLITYDEIGYFWVFPEEIVGKIFFETDYIYLPLPKHYDNGDVFNDRSLQFFSYYGNIYTNQQIFKLTPGTYYVIASYTYLPWFEHVQQDFDIKLRLDALWDLHSTG